ncbi:arabinogalactan endo-1,4-beta-galactosidase gala [Cladochytrium replicatum]|nr:arabinogalactan endo-1,4-beta-galactosidase gala [Cladochytrium replicatum]
MFSRNGTANAFQDQQRRQKYRGADISSLLMLESKGISYKTTSGSSISFEKLLAQSGANMARQRIWVNPSDGNYNLAYNLKLAARSKAAGLQIYLDLHFSDTWADPAHQTTPAKWAGQDINTLAWTVYNYTRDVSNAFANAGITPAMISIGNEIGGGFLWPLGSYNSYSNTARLLHSAAWGVKDSKVGKQTQIMIHVEDGWNWSKQQFFYDTVLNQGTLVSSDFDIMGVSYYPFYNSAATLANLKSTLLQMSTRYGKKLMVVETNWPYSCPSPSTTFPSDVSSISFSDPGQSTWMRSVATTVRSVNGGIGVMYWEPGWIGNAGLGSSCYDNLLVDSSGKARNSMGVFASL